MARMMDKGKGERWYAPRRSRWRVAPARERQAVTGPSPASVARAEPDGAATPADLGFSLRAKTSARGRPEIGTFPLRRRILPSTPRAEPLIRQSATSAGCPARCRAYSPLRRDRPQGPPIVPGRRSAGSPNRLSVKGLDPGTALFLRKCQEKHTVDLPGDRPENTAKHARTRRRWPRGAGPAHGRSVTGR